MNLLKNRPSVALPKKEESAVAAPSLSESKEDESKRASFSTKMRLSLSFRGKTKESSGTSSSAPSASARNTKATPDNPHPYEDIDSLPNRSRATSRKSVTWKDPQTNDLNEVLRARSKSVKGRDGRRTSLSWTQPPLST